jgi:hypothetical protein
MFWVLKLLTLGEAAKILHGTVTINSLRRAGRAGRLRIIAIGGKHYTTEAALADFLAGSTLRTPCRADDSPYVSGSDQPEEIAEPHGSSSTDRAKLALEQALESANRLKRPCADTSSRATVHGLPRNR